MDRDPYAVLGVARTASDREIKQAFRQLARECHPDVAGTDAEAARRFKAVRAAYELLSDPARRARHDRRHDRPAPGSFDTFWRASMRQAGGVPPRRGSGLNDPANRVSLDDLMNFDTVTRERPRTSAGSQPRPPSEPRDIDVPLGVALRGGTITVTTTFGPVHLTIPARCHGGTRLRLAGRGPPDARGRPTDLVVRTRIVLPDALDADGEALLDALAQRLGG